MILLAGDVGATKTALAIATPDRGACAPCDEATLPSGDYKTLEDLIEDYLRRRQGPRPTHACLGAAGPVIEGCVKLTNIDWNINASAMAERLGLQSVELLNDVEATAYGALVLDEKQKRTIIAGKTVSGGTMAVVAPGTGLGKAFLTWDGSRYRAHASEGGHAGFAPANDLECDLVRALSADARHVSWESVCSGMGIPRLYAFLRDRGAAPESSWIRDEIVRSEDPTPVIVKGALTQGRRCDLCASTVELFASILGSLTGNMALEVLAEGGVYLAGGMPPRVLPAIESDAFVRAFRDKEPMTALLARIPVHVVLEPRTALLGSAHFGLSQRRLAGD
ncbi:MAG: glucokinase [Vicinamibacteria bacterium]|nr:glucokinase [Vicinamibacteria bacterium]